MKIEDSRLNPISPNNENCYECYAQLLIYPAHTHPNEVSEFLKLEATKINIVGDIITNSLGKTREVKLSGWFLSSELHVTSKDLRDHLNWFIEKLNPVETELRKLQSIDDVTMTLCCVWRSKYGHGGPVLWPEQMKSISDLNLECSFDVYFNSEE
ncbi:DUF4279 domain-containing protein [Rahnella sp. PCH160]|uniref:DUF4279 domain-containing protein n=1 Tax=Rahnella sp. PCH160 TaxID=3447928 RepID=UPI0039FD1BA0